MSPWRQALLVVGVTRAALLAVAAAGARLLGDSATGARIWRRWDADLFAKIAEQGYAGPGTDPWAEAFFPLLPLLLRGFGALGVGPAVAGLIVSAAASVVAVRYLIELAEHEEPGPDHTEEEGPAPGAATAGTGRRAALYLLLFPTAVFLVAGYSEALFLAGAVPAFLFARQGRWLPGGLAAVVAVGARAAGVFVLAGLAAELVTRQRDRWRQAVPALVVGAAPAAAYVGWLWATRGSATFLLTAQREGWDRQLVGPLRSFRTTWWAAWNDPSPHLRLTWSLEILAVLVGLAVVVWTIRRRHWHWTAYTAAPLAILASSSWYYSVPRVLLTFVPGMIYLAGWSGRARWRHDLVLAVTAPLAALGVLTFTRGGWFF